jgi:hypothetical protein
MEELNDLRLRDWLAETSVAGDWLRGAFDLRLQCWLDGTSMQVVG